MDNHFKTIFDYTPVQAHSILAKYIKEYPVKFKISKKDILSTEITEFILMALNRLQLILILARLDF